MATDPNPTWVGYLNWYVFRWFWFRLAYQLNDRGRKHKFSIVGPVRPSGWYE